MPHLLDADYRARLITEVFVDLVSQHGVRGPSVRALAAGVQVAPSTLLHHLGTQRRLRHVVAAVLADRLEMEAERVVAGGDHVGLLPHDALPGSRERHQAWLGVQAVALGDDDVAAVVRRHDLVTLALAHRLSPVRVAPTPWDRLDGWARDEPLADHDVLRLALVEGLRQLCTRRVRPVPVAQAVRVLVALLPRRPAPATAADAA